MTCFHGFKALNNYRFFSLLLGPVRLPRSRCARTLFRRLATDGCLTLVDKSHARWTQFTKHSCRPLPLREFGPRAVPVPGVGRDIRVKIASTPIEWRQAFQLVADNYQARGYESGDSDCRFTSYHALPESVVLVAKTEGVVVATLSLFPDSTLLGMPCEGLYQAEIQELRRAGHRLFETGCLAERGLKLHEWLSVFTALMRLGWQHQVRQGASTTVIAVNPRHSSFYTRLHGFLPLGSRRSYAAVQGHPAEAFYLSPELMQTRSPKMYREIFGAPLPRQALEAPAMPAHLIRHFARNSSQTDPRLVEEILTYVEAHGSSRRW